MEPIECVVTARVSSSGHGGGRLVVWIRHIPQDPLAVRLGFAPTGGPGQSTATWVFAGTLLTHGVNAPAGEGDVRVRPAGTHETDIELRTVRGRCVVRFPTAGLRSFLARTESGAPRVGAQIKADLDRLLADILRHV